jgi:hypothetical protein
MCFSSGYRVSASSPVKETIPTEHFRNLPPHDCGILCIDDEIVSSIVLQDRLNQLANGFKEGHDPRCSED